MHSNEFCNSVCLGNHSVANQWYAGWFGTLQWRPWVNSSSAFSLRYFQNKKARGIISGDMVFPYYSLEQATKYPKYCYPPKSMTISHMFS
jgi:hypothetical protein